MLNKPNLPDELTEEEQAALDAALAHAAETEQAKALPAGTNEDRQGGEIVTADTPEMQEAKEVIRIVGADYLKRNIFMLIAQDVKNIQNIAQVRERIFQKFEEESLIQQGRMVERIKQNSQTIFDESLATMGDLLTPKAGEQDKNFMEYLESIDQLLEMEIKKSEN